MSNTMLRSLQCIRLKQVLSNIIYKENSSSVARCILPLSSHDRCLSFLRNENTIRDERMQILASTHTLVPKNVVRLWPSIRSYAKNKGKDKGGKGKKVTLTSDQLEGVVDLDKVTEDLDKVLEDLKEKFIHQVTVRTSQGVFNNLTVKTPDGSFPLIQLGQLSQKSPQLLVINLAAVPQYISHVKEAFANSGLNVNPQQDGTSLFIPIPKVTREHREGLVKNAKMLSEKSKKQLRDAFSKYSRKIKASKEGHSADILKAADTMVMNLMHEKMKQVEDMTELKRQELMGGK